MKMQPHIRGRAAAIIATLSLLGCHGPQPRHKLPPLGYAPLRGKLEQPLVDYMAKVPTGTPISIVVVLKTNLTEADKRILFQAITATNQIDRMEQERTNLIHALTQLADNSQAPLLNHLRGLETNGVVLNVRSFWISNLIGLQAPASVINALATSNEVALIHLDLPRPIFRIKKHPPHDFKQFLPPKLPVEAGQQTVVVAVLDTGVDYTHPDLSGKMWINAPEDLNKNGQKDLSDINNNDEDGNNYFDDVIGWNFSGTGNNEPQDGSANGHGTHVAGIVAGAKTGLAPNAKIMALRESNALDDTTQQECWVGIQYAITKHAHIINFSSGWSDWYHPLYTSWRNAVQNATDAGLLFIAAAGDDGQVSQLSPPTNVITPGRVPAALTVGASGSAGTVIKLSSRGPVTWENVAPFNDYPYTPGLIKPDLVAPGEKINSTKNGGGYVTMSGTSMAAPSVAAVAALVRAQNASLNPYELRYLLEESATPSGGSAPNSDSGWGQVNAPAALLQTISSTACDLSVDNLSVDPSPPSPNTPLLFSATVKNLGGQVAGNTELRFYFADAASATVGELNNGQPNAKFTYIGSYFVPVIGPNVSKHQSFKGVVRWTIPGPRQQNWWLGVWVQPGPKGAQDNTTSNNGAVLKLP